VSSIVNPGTAHLLFILSKYDIILFVSDTFRIILTEGGARMTLISFILSIIASVIAYYICKWLDR